MTTIVKIRLTDKGRKMYYLNEGLSENSPSFQQLERVYACIGLLSIDKEIISLYDIESWFGRQSTLMKKYPEVLVEKNDQTSNDFMSISQNILTYVETLISHNIIEQVK